LANITVAGVNSLPSGTSLTIAGQPCEVGDVVLNYSEGVLYVSGLESLTSDGAWEGDLRLDFSF